MDSKNSQTTPQPPAQPQYANYWAPLMRKRHIPPHPAQPQHTNHGAPRTRKRHQQVHWPQWPTESSDPTQHAKGRTGDCPGPRKETTTRRNVTQGGYPSLAQPPVVFDHVHPWVRTVRVYGLVWVVRGNLSALVVCSRWGIGIFSGWEWQSALCAVASSCFIQCNVHTCTRGALDPAQSQASCR